METPHVTASGRAVIRKLACALAVVGAFLALSSTMSRAQQPSVGALVLWPNCASPGDSVKVKTGRWPNYGGHQFLVLGLCDSDDGTIYLGPGATSGIVPVKVDGQATAGVHNWSVVPIRCVDPEGETCDYIPSNSEWVFCQSAELTVTNDTGDPFVLTTPYRLWGTDYGSPDSLASIVVTFSPDLFCNTSPCDKIRLIQTVRPQVVRGGQVEYSPFASMASARIPSWQEVDDVAVDGWSVDFIPSEYVKDGTGQWISLNDGECDPYQNGEDDHDLHRRLRNDAGIGSMGPISGISFFTDIPGGGGDALYTRLGITGKIYDFEVNAFCSDGMNEGEWIGRVTWRWEKHLGLASRSSVISTAPKAKPTEAFMDALRSWCTAKGFRFPEVQVPTTGGVACHGELCFPEAPQLSRVPSGTRGAGVPHVH